MFSFEKHTWTKTCDLMFLLILSKESSCFCGSSITCVRVSGIYPVVAEVMCWEWRKKGDWFKKGNRKVSVVTFDFFPKLLLLW